MKKIIKFTLMISMVLLLAACGGKEDDKEIQEGQYTKYDGDFYETFDTQILVSAYVQSQDEFDKYFNMTKEKFTYYHQLYDNFNNYEGVHNIKTINDQAGIAPVEVDQEIIDLLIYSIDEGKKYGGKVDISMGPVLQVWHKYREEGLANPEEAKLPPMEELEAAKALTGLDKIQINEEEKTVFLPEKGMAINVGATAKGYATEKVVDYLKSEGLESAIISAGGNVDTIGKPMDKDKWGIGLQNPYTIDDPNAERVFDVVFATDMSVVTSGDYQRFYTVDGQRYHHIIDPETLMPANEFRAVTVVTKSSALADFLSTPLYLLPIEEGMALAEEAGGEVVWYETDNDIVSTPGMDSLLKSKGASPESE